MPQPLRTSSLPPPWRRILPRVHTVAALERQTVCWPPSFRALGHGKVASGALPKAARHGHGRAARPLPSSSSGGREVHGQFGDTGEKASSPTGVVLRDRLCYAFGPPLVHVPAQERGIPKSWEHNTAPPTPRSVVSWSSPPQASLLPAGCLRCRLGKRARPVPVG